jgi:hypothetical protein
MTMIKKILVFCLIGFCLTVQVSFAEKPDFSMTDVIDSINAVGVEFENNFKEFESKMADAMKSEENANQSFQQMENMLTGVSQKFADDQIIWNNISQLKDWFKERKNFSMGKLKKAPNSEKKELWKNSVTDWNNKIANIDKMLDEIRKEKTKLDANAELVKLMRDEVIDAILREAAQEALDRMAGVLSNLKGINQGLQQIIENAKLNFDGASK